MNVLDQIDRLKELVIQTEADRLLLEAVHHHIEISRRNGGSGFVICGKAGTGKSTFAESIAEKYRSHCSIQSYGYIQQQRGSCLISASGVASRSHICSALLKGLGDPEPDRGVFTNRSTRLLALMRSTNLRLILIDNAQALRDPGTGAESGIIDPKIATWLTELVDTSEVSIGLVGCISPSHFCAIDPGFRRRFGKRFEIRHLSPPLKGFDSGFQEVVGTITSFLETECQIEFDFDARSLDFCARLYALTNGLIDCVMQFYIEMLAATQKVLSDRVYRLDLNSASKVAGEFIFEGCRLTSQDPFTAEINYIIRDIKGVL